MRGVEQRHWVRLGGYALVLGLVSLAVTWPGLSGTWVGDDWHMVDNYLYEEWGELLAVFKRNAASYLFSERIGPYRPVTMFTLLATHLLVPEPWLHHAVSWLLHAATSVLLFAVLRSPAFGAPSGEPTTNDWAAAALAGLFFLHPVNVESYVWINGRADLLAGFWLVTLGWLLCRIGEQSRRRPGPFVALTLVAFLGASSKLPFVVAAVATGLAWALRTRSTTRGIAGVAVAVGVAFHLVLREIFAPFRGQVGATENVFEDPAIWPAMARIGAKGTEALVTFRAEAMQSLSWALFGPWTTTDWLGLAIALLATAFVARRRDLPGLVLWMGGFATLMPVVMVSAAFWFGFDRYLYMPAILALMALLPHIAHAACRSRTWSIALSVSALAILAYAAFQTRTTSRAYANQEAFDATLLEDHFDDPSIHYYFAAEAARRGDPAGVRLHLSEMPAPPWPRPIIVPTYELAARAGDPMKVREAVDALVATARGPRCAAVRDQLEVWVAEPPDDSTAAHLEDEVAKLECEP